MADSLDFDFDFGTEARGALLKETRALAGSLAPGDAARDPRFEDALTLLDQLDAEVAEFSAFPEFVPLQAADFERQGLALPPRFVELAARHRFYWVRFPITLKPRTDRPFVKLQCAVEFNPGTDPGHLRPVAQCVLPDRKFQQLMQTSTRFTVSLGEDLEFKANAAADSALPGGGAAAKAAVDATLAAGAGAIVGPFTYTWNRALINHSGTGSEKVFWSLNGAEFFEAQEPVLVVVLRVPKELTSLRIAAALQASHKVSLLAGTLGSALELLGERIRGFFRAGAPTRHTQTWDLTPRLVHA